MFEKASEYEELSSTPPVSSVPDSGSTVLLLALGLAATLRLRRR
jgi:hypothetical protein